MTDFTDDQLTAIQNVVDRVGANQDGAPDSTVADELRAGLGAADVEVPADQVDRLAGAIGAAEGTVAARDVLA